MFFKIDENEKLVPFRNGSLFVIDREDKNKWNARFIYIAKCIVELMKYKIVSKMIWTIEDSDVIMIVI